MLKQNKTSQIISRANIAFHMFLFAYFSWVVIEIWNLEVSVI